MYGDKFRATGRTQVITDEKTGREVTLHEIVATRDIAVGRHEFYGVKKGDVGGWVQYLGEDGTVGPGGSNLRQNDEAWVGVGAKVYDNARVTGSALVAGRDVVVRDHALVLGNAMVSDHAQLRDTVSVGDHSRVGGYAELTDNVMTRGMAVVRGYVKVSGRSQLFGMVKVNGTARVRNAHLSVGKVSYNAQVNHHNHVIFVCGLTEEPVTVYRTEDGHTVVAGCQTFELGDDLAEIAEVNEWDLPEGWEEVRDGLLKVVKTWH